jgi:ATP adenylyltransferase
MLTSFEELRDFLATKGKLRMSHIYKPTMLLTLLRSGGTANKEAIAKDFMLADERQIKFYKQNIVHDKPGKRLVRDGLVTYDKEQKTYSLSDIFEGLSATQSTEIMTILEGRITEYLEERKYPFGDSNLDAVPGSLRYEVLAKAKKRCELCGVSASKTQIDVDHIVPRSKGGSNKIENLQALCRTCNAQKSNRDDTDFRSILDSYSYREKGCVFCELPKNRVIAENELALAFEDGYAVTEGHTLVIPKRHVSNYFDLYQPERNAVQQLLDSARDNLMSKDSTITGFNIGNNAGASAGQTIFHCHVHLIPRRDGDCDDPRGGVRGVIPEKQKY